MEKKLKEAKLDLSLPCALEKVDKVKCVEIEGGQRVLQDQDRDKRADKSNP